MSFDTLLSILFVVVFIVLPLLSRAFRQGGPAAGRGSQPRADRRQPPGGAGGGAPRQEAEAPPWLAEAQRRVREAQAGSGGATATEASTTPGERPLVSQVPADGRAMPAGSGTLVPEDPFGTGKPPAAEPTLVPEDPFSRPAEPPASPTLVPDAAAGQAEPRQGGLVPDDPYARKLASGQDAAGGAGQATSGLGREGVPAPTGNATAAASRTVEASGAITAKADGGRRRSRPRPEHAGSTHARGVAAGLVMEIYVRRSGGRRGARLRPVELLRFDRRAVVSGMIWHEILDEPAWKRRRRRALSRPR